MRCRAISALRLCRAKLKLDRVCCSNVAFTNASALVLNTRGSRNVPTTRYSVIDGRRRRAAGAATGSSRSSTIGSCRTRSGGRPRRTPAARPRTVSLQRRRPSSCRRPAACLPRRRRSRRVVAGPSSIVTSRSRVVSPPWRSSVIRARRNSPSAVSRRWLSLIALRLNGSPALDLQLALDRLRAGPDVADDQHVVDEHLRPLADAERDRRRRVPSSAERRAWPRQWRSRSRDPDTPAGSHRGRRPAAPARTARPAAAPRAARSVSSATAWLPENVTASHRRPHAFGDDQRAPQRAPAPAAASA